MSENAHSPNEACLRCPSRFGQLQKLGIRIDDADYVLALAGNPNSGKTTIFNNLTGTRQHVANYPGVTVEKRTGRFRVSGREFELVDLPGVYTQLAAHGQ